MKTIYGIILLSILAISCCTPHQNKIKGEITDASMNTIAIVSPTGDTMHFSTLDAERIIPDGLLLQDSATIYYTGKYKTGMPAQKIEIAPRENPIVGGDRDEHGCIGSAGYTWSEVRQDCIRLFEQGIRMEATNGSGRIAFLVFSPDSMLVELFFSDRTPNEILERRNLPGGGHAWNIEDDDTKNVRLNGNLWTISQREKLIYSQVPNKNNASLGEIKSYTYEGVLPAASGPGIRYTLTVQHPEYSGDGTFNLTTTYIEAENGKDESYSYTGRLFTQRGIPGDNDATVWQLVADNQNDIFNFLHENDTTLTLLNSEFKKNDSPLNYSLYLVK